MTDLAELKRLAEAVNMNWMASLEYSMSDAQTIHIAARNKLSDPSFSATTILALIQRVREAEANNEVLCDAAQCGCGYDGTKDRCLHHCRIATKAHVEGRLAGIEEAAKVARSFDKSLMSMSREDVLACQIEQAILALKEEA